MDVVKGTDGDKNRLIVGRTTTSRVQSSRENRQNVSCSCCAWNIFYFVRLAVLNELISIVNILLLDPDWDHRSPVSAHASCGLSVLTRHKGSLSALTSPWLLSDLQLT